jgi:putative endonuclease
LGCDESGQASQTELPIAVILRSAGIRNAKGCRRRIYVLRALLLLRLHNDESLENTLHGCGGDLEKRVFEHKQGIKGEFVARYRIDRLVYMERFGDIHAAIAREKQIKGLMRVKKMALIVSANPEWKDLSAEWSVRHQYQPESA